MRCNNYKDIPCRIERKIMDRIHVTIGNRSDVIYDERCISFDGSSVSLIKDDKFEMVIGNVPVWAARILCDDGLNCRSDSSFTDALCEWIRIVKMWKCIERIEVRKEDLLYPVRSEQDDCFGLNNSPVCKVKFCGY